MTNMLDSQKLTAKQENFCQGVAGGLNQSDAYRESYGTSKMLPATVHQRAYELVHDSDITARIQELRDQITAGKAWSFARGMNEVETNISTARNKRPDVSSYPWDRTGAEVVRVAE